MSLVCVFRANSNGISAYSFGYQKKDKAQPLSQKWNGFFYRLAS